MGKFTSPLSCTPVIISCGGSTSSSKSNRRGCTPWEASSPPKSPTSSASRQAGTSGPGRSCSTLGSAFGSGSALAIPSEPQPFQLPGTSLPSGLACPTSRQLIHHPTAVDACPAPWPKKRSYPRTSLGLKTCEPTGTQKAARGKRHLFSWAMIQRTGKLTGACHPCAKGQCSTIKTSYTSRFEKECSRVHHLVSHATTSTIKHLVLPSPILLIEDARTWRPVMLVKQQ